MTPWETRFEKFITKTTGDAAHDLEHIRRVVRNAKQLCAREHGNAAVVIPAAWLHDCVHVPKNSPDRKRASQLAADAAVKFLRRVRYPPKHHAAIHHAIAAHSFSAEIAPQTREAKIVQDADRLDAVGAIGLARCVMLGGATGRRLYDPAEPIPRRRKPDDSINTVDHFFAKLLKLEKMMQTKSGRIEARRRTKILRAFLRELERETAGPG